MSRFLLPFTESHYYCRTNAVTLAIFGAAAIINGVELET